MSLSLPQSIQLQQATLADSLDRASGVSLPVAHLDPTRLAPATTEVFSELTTSPRMEAIREFVLKTPRELSALAAAAETSIFFTTQFDSLMRPMTAEAFISYSIFEGEVGLIEQAITRNRNGAIEQKRDSELKADGAVLTLAA